MKFDHEKLDVYRVAISFVVWTGDLVQSMPGTSWIAAIRQLDRAGTSIPLNIAEGNGKRSHRDRARFLDVARGSALEAAACLDVLIARRLLRPESARAGKALLVRIVEMLTKLIERLLQPR